LSSFENFANQPKGAKRVKKLIVVVSVYVLIGVMMGGLIATAGGFVKKENWRKKAHKNIDKLLKKNDPSPYRFELTSVRIIDGDTYEGDLHFPLGVVLSSEKVRLLNVDTPEVVGVRKKEGLEAKGYIRTLFRKGRVWVAIPRNKKQRDSFGRVLGAVYIQGNDRWYNVGRELIKRGYVK
jgi:endonuclease YncB( thermonuclease family)